MYPLAPYLELLKYTFSDMTEQLGRVRCAELQVTSRDLLSAASQTSTTYSIVISVQIWAYCILIPLGPFFLKKADRQANKTLKFSYLLAVACQPLEVSII